MNSKYGPSEYKYSSRYYGLNHGMCEIGCVVLGNGFAHNRSSDILEYTNLSF